MMTGRGLSGLAALLSNSIKGLELETRIKEQTCIMVWDEVVGEQVAEAAQPEFIREGRLFVKTKSAVWANELSFYKSDIMNRLNRRVGSPVLKEIVFKAGRIKRKPPIEHKEVEEPGLEGIELSKAEIEKVESAVRLAGEGASDSLRNMLETAARLEKWKKSQGWTPCKRCGSLQNTATGVCPPCRQEGA